MADDRGVLFENEKFAIGVSQVVSAGAIVAGIAQFKTLNEQIGTIPLQIYLTLMVLVLMLSIFAAFARHQYKMWDVKAMALGNSPKHLVERHRRARLSNHWLWVMRSAMKLSVLLLLLAFALLILGLWVDLQSLLGTTAAT